MTAFSVAFSSEVARVARKEVKDDLASMRKTAAAQRSEIAALRKDVRALVSQVRTLTKVAQRAEPKQPASQPSPAAQRGGRPFVFRHETLLAKRQGFGMTQAEMGVLLAASSLSVYRWESGKATPRVAQLERIREVLRMGVRQARRLVAAGQNQSALA